MEIVDVGDVSAKIKYSVAKIKENPDDSKYYYQLATYYDDIEAFEKANKCYRKVVNLGVCNSNVFERWGRVLFEQRKYAEAEEVLNKGLKCDSNSLGILKLLAQICLETQKNDNAIGYLLLAANLSEYDYFTNLYLGNAYCRLGRYSDAVKCLSLIADRDDEGVLHLVYLGIALTESGDFLNARNSFLRAIRKYPTYESYFHLAQLYLRMGNPKKALMAYQHTLSFNVRRDDMLKRIVDVALNVNKIDLMLACINEIEATEPCIFGIYQRRGLAFYKNGDLEKAKESFLKEYATKGEYVDWYENAPKVNRASLLAHLGVVYSRLGELTEALRYYKECIQEDPNNDRIEMIYPRVAEIEEKHGRLEDALYYWKEYLHLGKTTKGYLVACERVDFIESMIKKRRQV